MPRTAKLTADLTANTSRFETGMKRANGVMKDSKNLWTTSLSSMSGGFGQLAKGVASFVAIGKVANDIRQVVNFMDDTADAAKRVGTSSEEWSKLSYGAGKAEVDIESLEKAVTKLLVGLGNNDPQLLKTLNKLNLSAAQLRSAGPVEAIAQIADALNGVESPAKRAAFANDIFGKNVRQVNDLLLKGGAQIRQYGVDAQRAGVVVTEAMAQKAENLKEKLYDLDKAYDGFLISLADNGGIDLAITSLHGLEEILNGILGVIKDITTEFGLMTGSLDENTIAGMSRKVDLLQQKAQAGAELDRNSPVATGIHRLLGAQTYGQKTQSEYSEAWWQLEGMKQQQAIKDKMAAAANHKGGGGGGGDISETIQNILNGLKRESDEVNQQVDLYGAKAGAIERAKKELEISNQLTKDNVKLTADQKVQVDAYLDNIEAQTNAYAALEEQHKKLADEERDRQQAMQELNYSFQSNFEDAIISGKKLSDVLGSISQDIEKLLLRRYITAPFANFVTGGSTGGGLMSLISSILPSFDTGIGYVPHNMMANIHEGERVLTKSENAALNFGGGGGEVNVNIVNNAGAKVSASSTKTADGTDLNIMIDRAVAKNMNTSGSKTQQAMKAFNGQSLVKR